MDAISTEARRPGFTDDEVTAVYLAHQPKLERYVRSLTRNGDDAADVCQEVYLRLLVECRAGRSPETPAAWMHRVAHNLVVSASRRRQTDERTVERLSRPDSLPSTEDAVIRRERDAAVVRALVRASDADRTAMMLAAQGYRANEIGSRIGRTELATRTLLCRARGRLRTELVALDAA